MGTKVRGYGTFHITGADGYRHHPAHRVSFEAVNGPVPNGLFLDHVCHNRACVNPSHLRVVTNKQNQENRGGLQSNNTSGVRGVTWMKRTHRWRVMVGHNAKQHNGGVFASLEDAKARAKALRLELFTHNDADRTTS